MKYRLNFLSFYILLIVCLFFSGCAIGPVPPCPIVRVDQNTAIITKFRNANETDPDAALYKAQIVSFEGSCSFNSDGVEVNISIDLVIKNRPLDGLEAENFYYFVSLPRFFPDKSGKKVFSIQTEILPDSNDSQKFRESGISVFIPLEDRMLAASHDIYIGFQLTDEQLRYNRSLKKS